MEKDQEVLNIGVLDIYGFEIFQVRTTENKEWNILEPSYCRVNSEQ